VHNPAGVDEQETLWTFAISARVQSQVDARVLAGALARTLPYVVVKTGRGKGFRPPTAAGRPPEICKQRVANLKKGVHG
jgi:hypothetical protein